MHAPSSCLSLSALTLTWLPCVVPQDMQYTSSSTCEWQTSLFQFFWGLLSNPSSSSSILRVSPLIKREISFPRRVLCTYPITSCSDTDVWEWKHWSVTMRRRRQSQRCRTKIDIVPNQIPPFLVWLLQTRNLLYLYGKHLYSLKSFIIEQSLTE